MVKKSSKHYPLHKDITKRRQAYKTQPETVSIVCEGETEVSYLQQLRKKYRLHTVEVIQSKHPDIVTIANTAEGKAEKFDKVYCVFDQTQKEKNRKDYQKASRIIKRANENKQKVFEIISSPCFEIWILLHFQYTSGQFRGSKDLMIEIHQHYSEYIKGSNNDFSTLFEEVKINKAIKNSQQLLKGKEKGVLSYPSTNMHELVEYLKSLSLST